MDCYVLATAVYVYVWTSLPRAFGHLGHQKCWRPTAAIALPASTRLAGYRQPSVGLLDVVESIKPNCGSGKEITFLCMGCSSHESFTRIPKNGIAIGTLVYREVAFEH